MIPTIKEIISLTYGLKERDKALIEKAYNFAQRAHEGQLRKSGEPYFLHVATTAKNLADLDMSSVVIAAGLLHDVLEDAGVTEEELKK